MRTHILYTDDDHERAFRLRGFSRAAACALAGLGVAIAVIQCTSSQHVSGGLSSLIVAAVTLVAAVGSLFFALSAWSQILIWGVIAIAVGWAFFTVFREA